MAAALSEDSRDRDAKKSRLPRWISRLAIFLALYSPLACTLYQMIELEEHLRLAAAPCTIQSDAEVGEDESRGDVAHPQGDAQDYALPSFSEHAMAAPFSGLTILTDLAPVSRVQDVLPPVPISV